MGKNRFASHTRRFASLPNGASLYAAELSTGVVKVGCTNSPRGRLMALANEVRRHHSADLVRFHVVKRATAVGGRRAEVRVIERMKELGELVPGRAEFFRGVAFEQAVQVLDDVSSHGSAICPAEPLNTTQQIGVVR